MLDGSNVEERQIFDDAIVDFDVTWNDESHTFGSVAYLKADLEAYANTEYKIQWQMSEDNENWVNVDGATEEIMAVEITTNNYYYYWRVIVSPALGENQES